MPSTVTAIKMSLRRSKIKTVSDKITETFLPPAAVDPEDDPENLVRIADFLDDEADAESFVNAKSSEIRKRNVKLLSEFSEKYKGKVTSRRELDEDSAVSGSEEDPESEAEDSELEDYRKRLLDRTGSDKEEEEAQSREEDDKSDDDEDSEDGSESENEEGSENSEYASSANDESQHDANLLEESNHNAAVGKGLAVQNQLKIWEKLLEIRIHSQKMTIKANSLLEPGKFNELCRKDDPFNKLARESAANLERLLENMLEMQHLLAGQYPEMKEVFDDSGRKRQLNTSDRSSAEPPLKRFATVLSSDFECLTPYRNSVLRKWDDRTKILTPGAGARKANQSVSPNFDVIGKIEAVLLNKSDLLAKSQTVKGNYKPFEHGTNTGSEISNKIDNEETKDENVSSPEIYDDTDFYHQQLRELIEYKSNTSANPAELTNQFAELQKLRHKMKKKVDTRASKGRKLRYVVHNKLVNFMAPNTNSEWTDESKTELYRSLFAT